jgi:hypothetical protein
MPGRELHEFRHPESVVSEPKIVYDAFHVVYLNPQTPDLVMGEGTVGATLAMLDMKQVKQVWGRANGYNYLVA